MAGNSPRGTVCLSPRPGPAASRIPGSGHQEQAETGTKGEQEPGRSRAAGFGFDPFFCKKGRPKPGENRAKLEGTERRAGWERACWQPAFGAQRGACFKTHPSIWGLSRHCCHSPASNIFVVKNVSSCFCRALLFF